MTERQVGHRVDQPGNERQRDHNDRQVATHRARAVHPTGAG